MTALAEAAKKHQIELKASQNATYETMELARTSAGTRLALFFRDLGYGKVKVSFRSTGDVDVNRFAREFGGGGHAKASGALIPGSLDQVRDRVVGAAREYIGAAASS